MTDATARINSKQCYAPMRSQILQLFRFLAVDSADGADLSGELRVQAGVKTIPDEQQNARGKNAHDERQHASMPKRQSHAHIWRVQSHTCLPLRMYPRPRTVCSSFL